MGKILVTGVAGFIASKVAELLLSEGHTVVGVDNFNDAYDVRLKRWRLDQIQDHPGLTFERLDITDRPAIEALFERHAAAQEPPFDAVINLAARAGVRQSVQNPWAYFETNATGTLNLLELCRHYGVRKFVLSSTSSLYGKDNPLPFCEDASTDRPLSPYAASKKAAEALCYTYHHLYGIDVTVFRYFTVYGPAGRPDMSPFRFVQWISEGRPVTIYGDGQQSRRLYLRGGHRGGTVAGLAPLGYEVINLGSDQPVVLMDAIHLIERLVGRQAVLKFEPAHASDMPRTWANIDKAGRLLAMPSTAPGAEAGTGWRPLVGFEEGFQRIVTWYLDNRGWASRVEVLKRRLCECSLQP